MKKIEILVKKSVQKDIRHIPRSNLIRIQAAILQLQHDPVPQDAVPVRGYEQFYRLRVGRYRIVYEWEKKIRIITIIRIGHRKDVYKNM